MLAVLHANLSKWIEFTFSVSVLGKWETRCRICWLTLKPEQAVTEYWNWWSLGNILLFHLAEGMDGFNHLHLQGGVGVDGEFWGVLSEVIRIILPKEKTQLRGLRQRDEGSPQISFSSSVFTGSFLQSKLFVRNYKSAIRMFKQCVRSVVTTSTFFADTSFLTSL